MVFSNVVHSPLPMIFYVHHINTLVWVSFKHDQLLKRTLEQLASPLGPELVGAVRSFLVKYALVVHTSVPRVEYADIFIIDDLAEIMAGLGELMFNKHPYFHDAADRISMEQAVGSSVGRSFGNHRLFYKQ